jgi:AraC-like DNA-binding protein
MADTRGILRPEEAAKHFRLTRVPPSDDLAHLVDRHWSVEWDLEEPYTTEIVTHPSVNIAFEGAGTIHGVFTRRWARELVGSGHVIATKFRPGGFHPFHPVPAYTLTNKVIPLAQVFDAFAPRTFEEIEAGLRAHGWADDPRVTEITDLHALMLADPSLQRVEQLARAAGYSERTLQRLFREYVGVKPKWVLERIRLHEAAERMAEGESDWPALALDLGYFDQAHFGNDFRRYVGVPPAVYAA